MPFTISQRSLVVLCTPTTPSAHPHVSMWDVSSVPTRAGHNGVSAHKSWANTDYRHANSAPPNNHSFVFHYWCSFANRRNSGTVESGDKD